MSRKRYVYSGFPGILCLGLGIPLLRGYKPTEVLTEEDKVTGVENQKITKHFLTKKSRSGI